MSEDLAQLLADRLRALPFAERVVGLTSPYQEELPDTENRTKLQRWPVALQLPEDAPTCQRDLNYLLPDADTGSIFFFEDGTTTPHSFGGGVTGYQTTFRLLGWVNPNRLSAPLSGTVLAQVVGAALKSGPLPMPWQKLDLVLTYLPSGPSLWNHYTAPNPVALLLPPYQLLGVEVVARYLLCAPTADLPTLVAASPCH